MLTRMYSAKEKSDIRRTHVREHSPVLEGTRPVRQPLWQLGIEKDQEVKCQVADLVQRVIVELADGMWSSPVVLVCKKDHLWPVCVDYRRFTLVRWA